MTNVRKFIGPDARSPLTSLLVVVPATICVFVAWLLQQLSSILVMTILLIIWVLVILLLTSSCDPSIIPPEEDKGGRQTPSLQEGIPVYVAPDFSLPSQVSRDSIVEKVYGGKRGSTNSYPQKTQKITAVQLNKGIP